MKPLANSGRWADLRDAAVQCIIRDREEAGFGQEDGISSSDVNHTIFGCATRGGVVRTTDEILRDLRGE